MSTPTQRTSNTKKLVSLAMLAAIAFLVYYLFGRIPLIPSAKFLTYDPKDIIIAIGGFIYGPLSAALISIVVSLFEMLFTSETGFIGFVMNVLSTCAFACTAAFIYKRRQTLKFAVIGIISGVVAMVCIMLLWNYFITPMYMGVSRDAVVAMLLPVFLPFNLLKGTINAAVTMILYKPIVMALRKAGLVAPSRSTATGETAPASSMRKKMSLGVILVSLVVLASCILLILVWQGIL